MFEQDELTQIRGTVPLAKIFNSRVWEGLSVDLNSDQRGFALTRNNITRRYVIIDAFRWLHPVRGALDSLDLLGFLRDQDLNSPSLQEEFRAIDEAPIGPVRDEHVGETSVDPLLFIRSRRALPLSKILRARDWPGLRVEPFTGGIAFYLARHNRTERYVTLDDTTYAISGIRQFCDGFTLYQLLTDRIGVDTPALRREFIEFVRELSSSPQLT